MDEQQLAAVKQAMEALESERDKYLEWGDEDGAPEDVYEAITALQSIISQDAPPKQDVPETNFGNMAEPKIGCVNHDCDQCKAVQEPVATCTQHLQVEQLLNDMLATLPYNSPDYWIGRIKEVLPLCDTPPAAQPAVQDGRDWSLLEATQESLREHMAEIKRLKAEQPAQKPWVGLTDEDIEQGHKESWVDKQAFESAVWWAEKKLKEKNHDH